ncbi:hypothetical protein AMECASPLE_021148 [Ameca splendens]|uniref:Uncharacterized protein n=1 Tax=Ameca splendens TaxID=208324 RepID=A0ABV0YRS6_9TELE
MGTSLWKLFRHVPLNQARAECGPNPTIFSRLICLRVRPIYWPWHVNFKHLTLYSRWRQRTVTGDVTGISHQASSSEQYKRSLLCVLRCLSVNLTAVS